MPTRHAPWGLAVRAIIANRRGEWLLLRRSPAAVWWPGTWELPGGKVDPGEPFHAALEREVLEETGLRVSVASLAGASEFRLPHIRVVQIILHARRIGGRLRISDEHDEARWVAPRDLAGLGIAQPLKGFLSTVAALPAVPAKRRPKSAPRARSTSTRERAARPALAAASRIRTRASARHPR